MVGPLGLSPVPPSGSPGEHDGFCSRKCGPLSPTPAGLPGVPPPPGRHELGVLSQPRCHPSPGRKPRPGWATPSPCPPTPGFTCHQHTWRKERQPGPACPWPGGQYFSSVFPVRLSQQQHLLFCRAAQVVAVGVAGHPQEGAGLSPPSMGVRKEIPVSPAARLHWPPAPHTCPWTVSRSAGWP